MRLTTLYSFGLGFILLNALVSQEVSYTPQIDRDNDSIIEHQTEAIADNKVRRKSRIAVSNVKSSARTLEDIVEKVEVKGKAGEDEINHCKDIVYRTLTTLPEKNIDSLNKLVLTFDETDRRGLGSGSKVQLRCSNISDDELAAVTIHEAAHVYDLGILRGNKESGASEFRDGKFLIYQDDLSLEFYRISWESEFEKKANYDDTDFVSKYASTDCFEDFAETMLFYKFHGPKFRKFMKYNDNLAKKYEFMKNHVFSGQEFNTQSLDRLSIAQRVYDATTMKYDFNGIIGT